MGALATGGVPLSFALCLSASIVWVLVVRRSYLQGTPRSAGDVDVCDLAMLNGGPRLAAAVTLLELDRAGVIALGDGLLRRLEDETDERVDDGELLTRPDADLAVTLVTELPEYADEVERAVYRHVERSPTRQPGEIVDAAAASEALKERRIQLAQKGLVVGAKLRRQLLVFTWLGAPGAAIMTWGVLGAPVNGAAIFLLIAATMGAVALLTRRLPRRTRAGGDLLERVRAMRPEVIPAPLPPGATLDREAAAMLLALHGPGALSEVDPVLVAAVGLTAHGKPEVAAGCGGCGGWVGGGGCGGGCGGCGGCGGGCGGGGCGGG